MAMKKPDADSKVVLSVEEANAITDAMEDYMRLLPPGEAPAGFDYMTYTRLWNAADKALVPLRGGPFSMANRETELPKEPPPWR